MLKRMLKTDVSGTTPKGKSVIWIQQRRGGQTNVLSLRYSYQMTEGVSLQAWFQVYRIVSRFSLQNFTV